MAKDDLMPPVKDVNDPRFIKMVEGRDRHNAQKKAQKKQREQYQRQLTEIRAQSLNKAKEKIDAGDAPDPLEVVQDIMLQQMAVINNPEADPQQQHKEKELLLKATNMLADLLGSKPGSNIDAVVEEEVELSPEELEQQFKLRTKKLKEVK